MCVVDSIAMATRVKYSDAPHGHLPSTAFHLENTPYSPKGLSRDSKQERAGGGRETQRENGGKRKNGGKRERRGGEQGRDFEWS